MSEFAQRAAGIAWRYWPATAGLAALFLNLVALGFQHIGGMQPCPLCLAQRNVYWAVVAVSALSAPIWWRAPEDQAARAITMLIAGGFLTNLVIASYHAGAEWTWWPGPPCTGTMEDFDPSMISAPMNVVACDEPPYRFPDTTWGLSMAGQNAVLALGLAIASLLAAIGSRHVLEEVR